MGQILALGQAAPSSLTSNSATAPRRKRLGRSVASSGPAASCSVGCPIVLGRDPRRDGRPARLTLAETDRLLRSPDITVRAATGLQRFLVLFELGRATEMEEVLRRQVARTSGIATGRILLVSLLVDQGRLDEARAELELVPVDGVGDLPAPHIRCVNLALLAEATAVGRAAARHVAVRVAVAEHGPGIRRGLRRMPRGGRPVPRRAGVRARSYRRRARALDGGAGARRAARSPHSHRVGHVRARSGPARPRRHAGRGGAPGRRGPGRGRGAGTAPPGRSRLGADGGRHPTGAAPGPGRGSHQLLRRATGGAEPPRFSVE